MVTEGSRFELAEGSVLRDTFKHSINVASGTAYEFIDGAGGFRRFPLASVTTTVIEMKIPDWAMVVFLEPIGDDLRFSTSNVFDINLPKGGFGFVQDGKLKVIPVGNGRSLFIRADDGTVTSLHGHFESNADDGKKR